MLVTDDDIWKNFVLAIVSSIRSIDIYFVYQIALASGSATGI
jgi:hypothetical protein